ncbi:MAG: putative fructoselysine transporter [Methanosaeta sp. PtaB.Bin039]|nr:MAG: putative fructoselysine transporter [Methanosaeta sp. PtaB.Bin039]HOT06577.1 APC family permease [Methanotrichaceae archaeon]HQF16541.1 APC family permease [Methanotrichaceae archaeon]HQI91088.1 APC family permease [Methanotrichaceae archaeon]HQJ28521.1 APC family permease [Methanotrichaceae archaeon]
MAEDLKRELGLIEVTLSGIGIILGAGIYALLGEAAALAGNAVWMSFVLAALVALFTGLSYAEFSSMMPGAGAEYLYAREAFGPHLAFMTGWLIILGGAVGAAAVSLGFAGYLTALTGADPTTSGLVLLLAMTAVLLLGIKESARAAVVLTFVEIAGLLLVIYVGLPRLGSVDYMEMPQGGSGVLAAAALVFFAYKGFEEMVKLSDETRVPEKTMPMGILVAICASIGLYVLVSICSVSVLGWSQLASSSAPFAEIARYAVGQEAYVLVSLIALASTANTALLMILAASRITYGMARAGSLPSILGLVHEGRRTPAAAILAVSVLTALFLLAGDLSLAASVANFTVFLVFMIVNASLVILRHRQPQRPRPFKVPVSFHWLPVLPILGIMLTAFLMLQLQRWAMITGAAMALAGLAVSAIALGLARWRDAKR